MPYSFSRLLHRSDHADLVQNRRATETVLAGYGDGASKASFWYLKTNEIFYSLKYENKLMQYCSKI